MDENDKNAKFWWRDQEGKRKMYTIKWKELCKPICDWFLQEFKMLKAIIQLFWQKRVGDFYLKIIYSALKFLKTSFVPNKTLWNTEFRKGDSLKFINANIY